MIRITVEKGVVVEVVEINDRGEVVNGNPVSGKDYIVEDHDVNE